MVRDCVTGFFLCWVGACCFYVRIHTIISFLDGRMKDMPRETTQRDREEDVSALKSHALSFSHVLASAREPGALALEFHRSSLRLFRAFIFLLVFGAIFELVIRRRR